MSSNTDDAAHAPTAEHYRIGAIEAASDRLAVHFDGRETSRTSAQAAFIRFGSYLDAVATDGKPAHREALRIAQRVEFLTRQARQGRHGLDVYCGWLKQEMSDLLAFNWLALTDRMHSERARATIGLNPQADPGLGILRASEVVRDALDTAESIVFLLGEPPAESPIEPPKTEGSKIADESSIEDRAIFVLLQHPDWTNKEIARAVKTNPKYLSSKKLDKFRKARAALTGSIRRGSKSSDGRIEAIDDADDDFPGD